MSPHTGEVARDATKMYINLQFVERFQFTFCIGWKNMDPILAFVVVCWLFFLFLMSIILVGLLEYIDISIDISFSRYNYD